MSAKSVPSSSSVISLVPRAVSAASSKSSTNEEKAKRAERLKRLRELHMRRNESQKLNHREVVEEDRRKKLPANWEAKQRRLEWELEDEEKRKEALEQGDDYDRVRMLDVSAVEAEKMARKRRKKHNPDQGFSNYEDATARQYNGLLRQLKPDMEEYDRKRAKMGDAFYATTDTILQGLHKDTKMGIDRMVEDLEKQIDKRNKYSRRRMHNDDADIDYINERNMNFNKKLERFYGKYTGEIKQNLERGTAV